MSHSNPYNRLKQGLQARAKKAALLPMSRARADLISLRFHGALEALRRGKGWFGAAETMTRMLMLTGFLSDSGYGILDKEAMARAQRAIAHVLDTGKRSGRWCLDEATYHQFADFVNLHDCQLHVAPLVAYDTAYGRLGRMFHALRSEQPEGYEAPPSFRRTRGSRDGAPRASSL
ncbi:hypothetical protein [Paraburkholderia sp. J12]|uniref:hypothetical protein n=1 Tax=Paraburkholderia sp. J12 TaxID=2805432 RepID=UPI002ABDB844|nr:hypothetical protein [Paraburkholderia sp. J12]